MSLPKSKFAEGCKDILGPFHAYVKRSFQPGYKFVFAAGIPGSEIDYRGYPIHEHVGTVGLSPETGELVIHVLRTEGDDLHCGATWEKKQLADVDPCSLDALLVLQKIKMNAPSSSDWGEDMDRACLEGLLTSAPTQFNPTLHFQCIVGYQKLMDEPVYTDISETGIIRDTEVKDETDETDSDDDIDWGDGGDDDETKDGWGDEWED